MTLLDVAIQAYLQASREYLEFCWSFWPLYVQLRDRNQEVSS